ncbi:MAG: MBOAT family O-acyltransferase [Chthoniobacterales bacterium]
MEALGLAVELICCLLFTGLIVRRLRGKWREVIFALFNLACLLLLFQLNAVTFASYLALICLQYATLWKFAESEGWKPWIAFLTPITVLVGVRYLPILLSLSSAPILLKILGHRTDPAMITARYVGLSYLAFRSSYLVLEIRNGTVKKPDLWQYLGFCFFFPTMPVGPINTYRNYRLGFEPVPPAIPVGSAVLRILVGCVKFAFLGNILNSMTYSGLFFNDHYHLWIDLPVAAIFYYLYLYCNFSGFCDMAIGAAGLIGIPVPENFRSPLLAESVQDFWNRWHITLSHYMRDVVFTPLSRYFARIMGPAKVNHAIALTILIVFLLIGIWHGVGWNYLAFGAIHGLGVVWNHYYTLGLKKWLGRDGFKAYNSNGWVHRGAVVLTFSFVCFSFFFFANTPAEMKKIFSSIRWSL